MTKKKLILTILAASLILICVAAILFYYASLSLPYQRHRCADETPLESSVFLPKPDSMLYLSPTGEGRVLTNEEAEQIYAAFSVLMGRVKSFTPQICKCGDSIDINGKELILESGVDCIEFRYNRRQCYTAGSPAVKGYPLSEPLEFDAVMLVLQHQVLVAVPYKGMRYTNEGAESPMLKFYAQYYEFKQSVAALNTT